MSCGLAVKRPLDLGTDSSFELDVKRPRHSGANPQCSPFRPQLGILAASLNQSASTPNGIKLPPVDNSPFAEVAGRCQLSSNQLDSYLKAEIQHLKRRKLIPRRPQANGINSLQLENSIANFRKAQSPASSNSGSDSEGESATSHSGVTTTGAENKRAPMMEDLYEKPHFSLRQVKLICERLLKEQQIRLRYDYETILNKKLQEQHDQYVQFAKEQLDANAAKMGNDITYVS